MLISFHHQGTFTKTSYVGGKNTNVDNDIDTDSFGFPSVAKYVKVLLGYTEIGWIYVKGETGAWELVVNDTDLWKFSSRDKLKFYIDNTVDKSIQSVPKWKPHVVIWPRLNFIEGMKGPPKRNYVTLQTTKAQEMTKKVTGRKVTAKKKLEVLDNIESANELNARRDALSYNKVREMNIAANNERLASFNLPKLVASLKVSGRKYGKLKNKIVEKSEGYCSSNDIEGGHSCENESEVVSKQKKKCMKKVGSTHTYRAEFNLVEFAHEGDKEKFGGLRKSRPSLCRR